MTSLASLGRSAETLATQRGAPANVVSAVRQASASTGVDFSYLMEKAAVESGYKTDVKAATSSATGLFQFIERTWLDMVEQHGAKHGLGRYAQAISRTSDGTPRVADPATRREILELRKDPRLSALFAGELANDNKTHLQNQVGGEIGSTEMYLAHFLGAGGATKFLKEMRLNPHRPAANVLPEAAQANRGAFFTKSGRALSLGELYDRFAGKFGEPGAETSKYADSSPFGQVLAESTTSQPWQFTRSGATAREPLSTFTVMVLNALATPGDEEKDPAWAQAPRNGEGGEAQQRVTPNLFAGFSGA
ncbi:MAG TPA: hypothetical protein VED40_13915 [Azospirillaceae bacterium]|nr:hypothetical protein [Azospirillaceae bacterium]